MGKSVLWFVVSWEVMRKEKIIPLWVSLQRVRPGDKARLFELRGCDLLFFESPKPFFYLERQMFLPEFGKANLEIDLSLFPITPWGIFCKRLPSRRIAPFSLFQHIIHRIDYVWSLNRFAIMFDNDIFMLGWSLHLNVFGTLSTTSWLMFQWKDVVAIDGNIDVCFDEFKALSWADINLYRVWP